MLEYWITMILKQQQYTGQTSLVGYKYWTPSQECAILLGLLWQNNFNNNNLRRERYVIFNNKHS